MDGEKVGHLPGTEDMTRAVDDLAMILRQVVVPVGLVSGALANRLDDLTLLTGLAVVQARSHTDEPSDVAAAIIGVIRQAVSQLGEGPTRRAADLLLGIGRTRGLLRKDRRRAAAEALTISDDHFRKYREGQLLGEIADEIRLIELENSADEAEADPALSVRRRDNSAILHRPRKYAPHKYALYGFLLALALAGLLATLFLVPYVSMPGRSLYLGPADLAGYCRMLGYKAVSLDGLTTYDWYCTNPPSTRSSLSVIEACRWEYGRKTALARYGDIHIPDSWQCWDDVVNLGRVDLEAYCRAQVHGKPVLAGSTVDTWSCLAPSGRMEAIDPDSACRWQYGARVLVANVPAFRSPWEHWDCWS